MTINGKVIVITGVGAGLGRALSIGFVARGATVIGLGRNDTSVSETASLISDRRFVSHVVDVSDLEPVTKVMQDTASQFGGIDVLINNAAVYPKVGFLEQDADEWWRAITINIGGVANCCRAVLPIMLRQGRGRVINVGSYADIAPIPKSSAYAVSKGGLRALTRAIGAELAGSEVVCVEWIPGHLKTQMSDFTGMDPSAAVDWAQAVIGLPTGGRNTIMCEADHEVLPIRSLRSRVKDKLMFWHR
jgi:NAD(P)-dependent dehydrogenase (short-subunit alcohol dehydrogenase family)